MKSPKSSHRSNAEAPAACAEISRLIGTLVPAPMSPWQVYGFATGLICGLGPAPEVAFSNDEDPEGLLSQDCLDELSRKIEEDDCPVAPEDIASSPTGAALSQKLVALVADIESALAMNSGQPELSCSSAAAAAQDPSLADVPAARAYARGLLRGLIMSIEDEEELSAEKYGEVLSLVFILTEDDLGSDFGSNAEVAEARQAVATALPGLVAQLWNISHDESEED